MQEMKEEIREETLADLASDVKGYLNVRVEYIRLYAIERISKIFADLVTNVAVVVGFILAFLFGSITLALYPSSLFKSYTAGFGGVAVFYLILAVVVFLIKDGFFERCHYQILTRRYLELSLWATLKLA